MKMLISAIPAEVLKDDIVPHGILCRGAFLFVDNHGRIGYNRNWSSMPLARSYCVGLRIRNKM